MEFLTFAPEHLDAVLRLCEAEGWESYLQDPQRTLKALTSPGVVAVVAVEKQQVIGFAQVLTDGAIRAYLADLAVAAHWRGAGVGRELVRAAFAKTSAVYLDLLSTDGAQGFYERFEHRRLPGFRIYPQAEVKPGRS